MSSKLQETIDAQACDIKRLEVHIKAAVVELKVLRQALVTNNIHWFAVKTVDGVVDDLESQIED